VKTTVIRFKKVKVKNPVLIEGLPGVGHVGKLVAEHIIEELNGEKILEIISPHFPPQVIVRPDGTVKLVNNELYLCNQKGQDILVLVGDYQSVTNEGHYELTSLVLDISEEFNVSRIYTLGGYGTGQMVEVPNVLGATNNPNLIEEMTDAGVEFKENEPGGGIVGISGILLGLASLRSIDAICLMGVTSGYMVDPKSAQAVLEILKNALNIEVEDHALEERAKEMEKLMEKLKGMHQFQSQQDTQTDDDLRYIG